MIGGDLLDLMDEARKAQDAERKLILHCAEVNVHYMRLPAGQGGFQAVAQLYQRLAEESLVCARAWVEAQPCPPHEAVVDGFWWGVLAWADAFGVSLELDPHDWNRHFVYPHYGFAQYLKALPKPWTAWGRRSWTTNLPHIKPAVGHPREVILELDVRWTGMVIKLTARWGLLHHLKDLRALRQAIGLMGELHPSTPVGKAYLESDILFFRELFEPFPFSERTSQRIDEFLTRLETSDL